MTSPALHCSSEGFPASSAAREDLITLLLLRCRAHRYYNASLAKMRKMGGNGSTDQLTSSSDRLIFSVPSTGPLQIFRHRSTAYLRSTRCSSVSCCRGSAIPRGWSSAATRPRSCGRRTAPDPRAGRSSCCRTCPRRLKSFLYGSAPAIRYNGSLPSGTRSESFRNGEKFSHSELSSAAKTMPSVGSSPFKNEKSMFKSKSMAAGLEHVHYDEKVKLGEEFWSRELERREQKVYERTRFACGGSFEAAPLKPLMRKGILMKAGRTNWRAWPRRGSIVAQKSDTTV